MSFYAVVIVSVVAVVVDVIGGEIVWVAGPMEPGAGLSLLLLLRPLLSLLLLLLLLLTCCSYRCCCRSWAEGLYVWAVGGESERSPPWTLRVVEAVWPICPQRPERDRTRAGDNRQEFSVTFPAVMPHNNRPTPSEFSEASCLFVPQQSAIWAQDSNFARRVIFLDSLTFVIQS